MFAFNPKDFNFDIPFSLEILFTVNLLPSRSSYYYYKLLSAHSPFDTLKSFRFVFKKLLNLNLLTKNRAVGLCYSSAGVSFCRYTIVYALTDFGLCYLNYLLDCKDSLRSCLLTELSSNNLICCNNFYPMLKRL